MCIWCVLFVCFDHTHSLDHDDFLYLAKFHIILPVHLVVGFRQREGFLLTSSFVASHCVMTSFYSLV